MLSLLLLSCGIAFAGGKGVPALVPDSPKTECVQPEKRLVTIGTGSAESVLPGGNDHAYAEEAQCYLNQAYASGCLERKLLAAKFSTLERDEPTQLARNEAAKAWQIFTKNAPYALDLRWYSSRKSVVGYTYFDKNNVPGSGSETRMWTNSRMGLSSKSYGAHQGHELSHQRRAGAFGHWTQHYGSWPYMVGDMAEECIDEQF